MLYAAAVAQPPRLDAFHNEAQYLLAPHERKTIYMKEITDLCKYNWRIHFFHCVYKLSCPLDLNDMRTLVV